MPPPTSTPIASTAWSAAAQAERRQALNAMICSRFRPLLDDRAEGPRLLWWDQPRVELWSTQAFLTGDAADLAFANTIVRHVRDVLRPEVGPMPFEGSASASILAEHGERLDPDVRRYLQELLLGIAPNGMTRDYQFHGYNDNMPVMWSWALLYAGETFDRPELLRIARANLLQLKDLLRRRGTVAEYGMGYATHRLTGLALIGEHARDSELRALARDLEARVWAEIAGHWSPALGIIAGASMRGGHPLNREPHALFMQVFGRAIERPWMRLESHFETRHVVVELGLDPDHHVFAYPFAYTAEFAAATYHVPDAVAALFYEKPAPYRFACTAETGYVHEGIFQRQVPVIGAGGIMITTRFTGELVEIEDYPQHGAQPHQLLTYQGRHYAVGSSTTGMFRSSNPLTCAYRRVEAATRWADIGYFAMRYTINDKVPGGRHQNPYPKEPGDPTSAENYCQLPRDMGRHHCLQHDNTVLCLSTPDHLEHWDIRDLRLDLFFLQEHGPVRHWELAADGSRIDLNEGAVYLSIRPLIGRHLERQEAIRVREMGEWLVISLYNYKGPSRSFGKRELAKQGNGFVLEVRDAEDYPSFAAFQAVMAQARVLDQLYGGRRRVHYARPGLRLSTHYCPYTHTRMFGSVNGLEAPWEKLSFPDGLEASLPFNDGTPASGFEDWDWIETQIARPAETYNPQD